MLVANDVCIALIFALSLCTRQHKLSASKHGELSHVFGPKAKKNMKDPHFTVMMVLTPRLVATMHAAHVLHSEVEVCIKAFAPNMKDRFRNKTGFFGAVTCGRI